MLVQQCMGHCVSFLNTIRSLFKGNVTLLLLCMLEEQGFKAMFVIRLFVQDYFGILMPISALVALQIN